MQRGLTRLRCIAIMEEDKHTEVHPMNLTEELYAIKCRLGVIREIDCSDSENEEYRKLVSQG